MNKSERTRQRYRAKWKGQTTLAAFQFTREATVRTASPARSQTTDLDNIGAGSAFPEMPETEMLQVPSIEPLGQSPISCRTRRSSMLSSNSSVSYNSTSNPAEFEEESMDEEDEEEWEEELDAAIMGCGGEIRDWATLRHQIKEDLRKQQKSLPLSSVNQLLILSNFATLRLKGASCIGASMEIARQWHEGNGIWFARRVRALARHYQTFEQLPREKRGGGANAQSFLHNETVQARCRTWLLNKPTGSITPRALQHGLESTIFPELGIVPKQPISERTARRWLIKLGWRRTVIRKGVYMDGHEREDVIKYREEVYLPAMLKFEERMVHFEGPELTRVEPTLQPGERRIKPYYHDECCFHANDNVKTAWCV
jgi:hypothetical protein